MGDDDEQVVRRKKKNEMFDCLTDEDIEKYNEAFTVRHLFILTLLTIMIQIFDKNQSGRISMAELGEVMTNLGKSKPSEVSSQLYKIVSEQMGNI